MENNQTNNSQNTDKDTAPRDWWEERAKWRQERHQWRMKMREERWHWRWPFHGLFFGLTIMLLGLMFLLDKTGTIAADTWWKWLLVGLGSISIVDGLVRYFHPSRPWGAFGKFFGGIVMILIGTFFLVGITEWWPVIIIVAGAFLLTRPFWRRTSCCEHP